MSQLRKENRTKSKINFNTLDLLLYKELITIYNQKDYNSEKCDGRTITRKIFVAFVDDPIELE